MIVPMITIVATEDGNPSSVQVVGFGAFLVKEYIGNGDESDVVGNFINYVIPGNSDDDGADFGLYGSQLYE